MTLVWAKYKIPATLLPELPGLKLVVVPTPMRLILAVNVDSPDRTRTSRELPDAPPWLTERTALALVTFKVPPTPVTTLVTSFAEPMSVGVATIRPPVFVIVNVTPLGINVVWELFVLPYCNDPIVRFASTTLLMLEKVVAPASINCTSSLVAGTTLPDQLAASDQLVSVPLAPLQTTVAA